MQDRKEIAVKKLPALVILAALALSSCASGRFLGFLATNDYVDTRTKTLADQQAAQIDQLKSQIADNAAAIEAAKTAVDKMNKVQKTVADLRETMKDLEDKIGAMPKDVIKQIVDMLQASLN
jgi:outer membrane murein-binding lipoprotein Lpp